MPTPVSTAVRPDPALALVRAVDVFLARAAGRRIRNSTTFLFGGRKFASASEAARAHGVDPRIFIGRVRRGWPEARWAEPAAAQRVGAAIVFKGVHYVSIAEAARAFNVTGAAFRSRLVAGWSDDQVVGLEARPNPKAIVVAGRTHANVVAACRTLGKDYNVTNGRLARGWSVDEAFDVIPPVGRSVRVPAPRVDAAGEPVVKKWSRVAKSISAAGVVYRSIPAAAKALGLTTSTVRCRIEGGWTPEQALGLAPPPPYLATPRPVVVHGKSYPSIAAAARDLEVCAWTANGRLARGLSPEKAFSRQGAEPCRPERLR